MPFRVAATHLRDVIVLETDAFQDERGFFLEAYRADVFPALGLPATFVQDNHSGSIRDVVRGLHFQWDPPMGKLMRVTRGAAFLVAVDIRRNSPTLGQWVGQVVSAENRRQVWAPAGFARGFCVVSDYAEVQYKCTGTYNAKAEAGIRWNDPRIGIAWPVATPLLSAKDDQALTLDEWLARPESAQFTL